MSKALKSAIALASSGRSYPVMPLVRNEPELAALLSKLIPGREQARFNQQGEMSAGDPNVWELRNMADRTARDITDAETVMQLLPETELAATILISCVLSPKDMMTVELTYNAPEGLPPDIAAALVNRLKQYFESDYNIKPLLPVMLKDIFVKTGSYAVAVIPENSIDEVINNNRFVKMESMGDEIDRTGKLTRKGLLGPTSPSKPKAEYTYASISIESMGEYKKDPAYESKMILAELTSNGKAVETFTTVLDNPSLLKIPQINQKIREQRIDQAFGGFALEKQMDELSKLSDRELHNLLYKTPNRQYRPIDSIQTQERLNRRTVGSPLVMHLPSEAVIPVFVPGNVKQQVGFFVLIDADGNPIVKPEEDDLYAQMGQRFNTGGNFASAMLNKVQMNTKGMDYFNRSQLNNSAQVYGAMIEQDLLSRLRNGIYTNGVAIANKPEVYRIMLARALAAQHTQLLFLPIELCTYFALNYNSNGIGRSILDEMKILSSLRAMLTFANTMAAIKNSIGRTDVEITLDETDPDPQKTIERYMHTVALTRQQAFPIGVTSPVDLTDYMQRAGFQFSFTGHPRIPNTKLEFTEKNSQFVKPDTDLQDDFRKRSIQKFGIPAQVVDAGYEAEFATSIVTNNILISKNVTQIQDRLEPHLNDHLRKVAMNDEGLLKDLKKILEDNYEKLYERLKGDEEANRQRNLILGTEDVNVRKAFILRESLYSFVMGFSCALPRPNSVSLANQAEAFDKYLETLEKALDMYISTNILNSETLGDVSQYVDGIKENIKAYYARKWMAENGMMPELSDLVSLDEEGRPKVNMMDVASDHVKAIGKTINHFFDELKKFKAAANAAEQARQAADTTEGGASPTTGSTDTGSSDTGDGTSDGGGADPFGMGGGFDFPEIDDGNGAGTNENPDEAAGGEGGGTEGGTDNAGGENPTT